MTEPEHTPWSLMPPLRLDRLECVQKIAWDVQHRVAASADWKHGENLWVAGCRAFTQRVHAFSHAAKAEYRNWMSVETVRGQFILKVGGVPIRMYRPPAEGEVPDRYTIATREETFLLNHALELFALPPSDRLWRLEVHSDRRARPTAVVLVQVDSQGQRFNPYAVPAPLEVVRNADMVPSRNDLRPRKAPVVLPEVEVQVRRNKGGQSDERAAEGTGA